MRVLQTLQSGFKQASALGVALSSKAGRGLRARCGARAERELVLIKIRAPPGPTRMEVLQLVEIFRGRVADVSERSITLCVTGDAGKARAPACPVGSKKRLLLLAFSHHCTTCTEN